MVHAILTLVLGKNISDDCFVATALQRLGDLFLMTDKNFLSASACYLRCNTGIGTPGYLPGMVPVPEYLLGTGDGCRIPQVTRDIYYILWLYGHFKSRLCL